MPGRVYVADFAPNQLVEGVFTIQNCQLGMTKGGKPYLKCLIADRSGRAPGRMWNASEDLISSLPTDGFVYIEAQTQPYQGEMQVIIQVIERAVPKPEDLEHLLPHTKHDVEEMFAEVKGIIATLKSPTLRALTDAYFRDEKIMESFKQAPAAQALHHAYLGGLLEHTLGLLRLANVVTPLYPRINRDIVLTGLFLHDLGKCVELTWMAGFGYTDQGQLVGHVARGVVWLNQKASELALAGTPLSPECLHVLEHIILSHHGELEFGALKLPATPEAILIHMLDNIDAKMQMSLESARPDRQNPSLLVGNFTDKVWALGNVRMYRRDPFAEIPAVKATPSTPSPTPPAQKPIPKLTLGLGPLKGGL